MSVQAGLPAAGGKKCRPVPGRASSKRGKENYDINKMRERIWLFRQKAFVNIVEKSIPEAECFVIWKHERKEKINWQQKRKKKMQIFSDCDCGEICERLLADC